MGGWLEVHWPRHEGPALLSWGDSRYGNLIYRDFDPVAVLDWEMAGIAPPELDLAYLPLHAPVLRVDRPPLPPLPGLPDLGDVDAGRHHLRGRHRLRAAEHGLLCR